MMTFGKRTEKILAIAVVCALIAAAFWAFGFAGNGTAAAESGAGADAVTAGVYGSIDTDSDLWYFDGDQLDLASLRDYVATEILPVLRANDVDPVVIAVVDTGLDKGNSVFAGSDTHEELLLRDKDMNLLGYNSFYAAEGGGDIGDFTDESEKKHGTAVSSILAVLIRETGLSEYIKIYPIKASYPAEYVEEQKKGSITTNHFSIEAIRLGIEYAVSDAVGAEVINLSLCSTEDSETSWRTDTDMIAAVSEAVKTATVVAAAGNESTASTAHYYYPAAYNDVVGVMGYGDGNTPTQKTNYGSAYDIFAPGSGVMVSTESGVFRTSGEDTSGTSMSAPFVSFAAALFRLAITAEDLAGDFEVPRNSVINRTIATLADGDETITAKDGASYKKLDIRKLIKDDIRNIDYGWLAPTGLSLTAGRNGNALSDGAAVTVQTLRETGAGRSLVGFTASVLPADDTDPALAAGIEWSLVEYDDEGAEASATPIGSGGSAEHLFDRAGTFGVRATLTVGEGSSAQTFTEEFGLVVSHPQWSGSNAHIVPEEFISSDVYLRGADGAIPSSAVLYGSGESMTLTITTIEDMDYTSVSWYVNGTIAGNGAKFEFFPEGMPGKDYEITAAVDFGDGKTARLAAFEVQHKSWAAHPLFAILWTALGVGVIVGGVMLALHLKKRKAAAAETASDDKE